MSLLTELLHFDPAHAETTLSSIPARPGVFALSGDDSAAEPYISKSSDLRRRIERLLSPPEPQSKRLNLRDRVSQIEYSVTGSDFESIFLLYRVLRELDPERYRKRMRLGAVPLVKLAYSNPYPRAYVTRRLGKPGRNVYYGPFLSHAVAEKFLSGVLDLFKTRRCTFDLNPDPAFPGCVYSEMKMCLAPCFKGCTDEAYAVEVARLEAFLNSRGESLSNELGTARDAASELMQFEEAAAIHTRVEKAKAAVAGLPEIVHRLDQLHAWVIQPSAERENVAVFRVHRGALSGPFRFGVNTAEAQEGKSLESRVAAFLQQLPEAIQPPSRELGDHLSILKRWYYRSSKVGELIPAEASPRKLARAISRVWHGESAVATDPENSSSIT